MSSAVECPTLLQSDEDGVVRVGGTRVTLDTIVEAFKAGATAEQIADDFSTLPLGDIYATIGYYLNHVADVEAYLSRQRIAADELRRELESRYDRQGIRERLLTRRTRQDSNDAPVSG